jgi:hypothetical protein
MYIFVLFLNIYIFETSPRSRCEELFQRTVLNHLLNISMRTWLTRDPGVHDLVGLPRGVFLLPDVDLFPAFLLLLASWCPPLL